MRETLPTQATVEAPEQPARIVVISKGFVYSFFAIGSIAAVVLWRTWVVLRWTFQQDDWIYVYDVTRFPFFHYAIKEYPGNHLMPGQFGIVWIVTKIAPLNYGVAQAPLLIMMFVSGVLMWRLLIALFGHRPANLIPLAVFMLCPLTVPVILWWSAALTIIPLQLFIVATLYATLRYVRSPSRGRLLLTGLSYAGGLLFWQKALLILPLVILFVVLFLGEGRGVARLRSVTRGRWQLWAILGGITAAYLPWYLVVAHSPVGRHPAGPLAAELATKAFGSTIIPPYLGGPWKPSSLGPGFVGELSSHVGFMTNGIAAAIVVGSLLLRRQAHRAWIMLTGFLVLEVGLVIVARIDPGFLGVLIGLQARYFADSVPVFALALALAFMVPIERRDDPAWTGPALGLRPSPPARLEAGEVPPESRVEPGQTTWGRSSKLVLGVVLLYAASSLITSVRMAAVDHRYSGKAWFAAVRSSLASHPTASIVDTPVPEKAYLPAFFFREAANASHVFAAITPGIRWNRPSEHPLIFDDAGNLRPVKVIPAASARTSPGSGCAFQTEGASVTVPLSKALPLSLWGVRLSYLAEAQADGSVTVDGDRQPVRFDTGPHVLTLVHLGTATTVTIESPGLRLCVDHVEVGDLRPSI